MNNYSTSKLVKERLGGRNLYLVGMMGSGKTRTGPCLAKEIGYGFVDSDSVLEQLVGKSIPQIFEEDGEVAFREVEAQVLNAIGQRHSLVVATGGGIVLRPENWGVLHQGIVIWLDPGREELLARLQVDSAQRPLLQGSDPVGVIDHLLKEREPFYREADLHLPLGNESLKEVVSLVIERIPSIIIEPGAPAEQQTIEG